MKILTLRINRSNFDRIISERKKYITKVLKPTIAKRHVNFDENGLLFELIKYDAIRITLGDYQNKDSALVKIDDFRIIEFFDGNINPVFYSYKGKNYQALEVDYFLGEILEKNIVSKKCN